MFLFGTGAQSQNLGIEKPQDGSYLGEEGRVVRVGGCSATERIKPPNRKVFGVRFWGSLFNCQEPEEGQIALPSKEERSRAWKSASTARKGQWSSALLFGTWRLPALGYHSHLCIHDPLSPRG